MPVLSGSSNAPLDKICLHAYIYKDVWATNCINNMKKKMSVVIKSKAGEVMGSKRSYNFQWGNQILIF